MQKIRNYGLPYKGSKSRIAEWLVDKLPDADTLVDVFFGGGSITHCALLSGKYNNIICNDIRDTPKFFLDCVAGKYQHEKRWISREDFLAQKDTDLYIACCWSFGNDCKTYLYGRKIEPYKKACHYAVVFDDWEQFEALCPEVVNESKSALEGIANIKERRLKFGTAIVSKLKEITDNNYNKLPDNPLYKSTKRTPRRFGVKLADLECLQSLERLERLQSLERIESNITPYACDYRALNIPKGAVVYCDPPYKNSGEDYGGFDTPALLDWAADIGKTHEVYVSEYSIDDQRFELVGEKEKIVSSAAKITQKKIERLYKVVQCA